MTKYLEHFAESDVMFTQNKKYEVDIEGDDLYVVKDDSGHYQTFSKTPDEDGYSYENWFRLVDEDDR